ncbi:hypothetical protein FRC03_012890 [Tulasnella sp. 419]|nr:hypothetical protein FRC03_012890 [Tulasnella sp. 419]
MSSTTHIDKLPTELLEHIFFYYFVDLEKANGLDNILTLTIVSRRWRSTAFCYPYLWSTIQVTESQSDHWRIKVDKWLWRSGDVPLTIDIRDCRTQLITEVITPFLPHSHRWRKLAISEQGYWIEQDEIPQIIPSAPNDPNLPQQLPCLEVLKLGGAYRRIRSLSILRPLHIIAPSLKDLSISDFFLDWAQLRLSADLLTNLNIQVTKHPR